MAIAMTCECGLTVRAREEHAGKRIKCPQCGKVAIVSAAPASRPQERQAFPLQLDEGDAGLADIPISRPPAPAAPSKPAGVDPSPGVGAPAPTPAPAGAAPLQAAGGQRRPYPVLSGLVFALRILSALSFTFCILALIMAIMITTGATVGGSTRLMLSTAITLLVSGISLLMSSEVIRVAIDAVRLLREIRDELRLARPSA